MTDPHAAIILADPRAIIVLAHGSIIASVYNRELSPEQTRRATFINPIGRGEDDRPEHHKHVSGCESDHCNIEVSGSSRKQAA